MRGVPHYHILLWIENAPVVDIDCPEEVCSFIQDRITCHTVMTVDVIAKVLYL